MQSVNVEKMLALPAGVRKREQIFAASGLKAILIRLTKGETMAEHAAPGSITVHCLMGRIDFYAGSELIPLERGSIVCLEERALHRLEALEDSAFLLTIASHAFR